MPSTAGETARALRDRPLGRILVVAMLLLVALLVARTCGAVHTDVSEEQAIAIAKERIAYAANHVQVRLIKRGLKSRPFWAVSLSQEQADGTLRNITVVVVDARTGVVTEVRHSDTG